MNIPKDYQKDFEAFPARLKQLLEAELAAGNEIAEFGHGFPAPPAGAYIKLAKPLLSRPRASGNGIDFYDRNLPSYSGEITDSKRFFFLLEPPHPPEPEPNMDAIRDAIRAKQEAATAELLAHPRKQRKSKVRIDDFTPQDPPIPCPSGPGSALQRFIQSMEMNYEKWHDGTGYDLDILKTATPQELTQIEDFLIARQVVDWRDVEALAVLDTQRARALLRKTLKGRNRELATAVTDYAPHLVSEQEQTRTLVAALKETDSYTGLVQALLQVEDFHPPEVVDALFRGVLTRNGEDAVHFAAMLMFLYGKADSAFDWSQRPFFLKFNTENHAEREAAFRELCEKLGVNGTRYLAAARRASSAGGGRRSSK
jgi:hypothetical protein